MASQYDAEIKTTLPLLGMFYQVTLNLVHATGIAAQRWLDTGCGTGTFAVQARQRFTDVLFTLADPSQAMLQVAQAKLDTDIGVSFRLGGTGELDFPDGLFDVITAIQCHHYLDQTARRAATRNCFRMLAPGGVYVTFENIRPTTAQGVQVGLRMWGDYQIAAGRTPDQAREHARRFDAEYHPITIPQHMDLLRDTGFKTVDMLWASYMQAGFWAVKP